MLRPLGSSETRNQNQKIRVRSRDTRNRNPLQPPFLPYRGSWSEHQFLRPSYRRRSQVLRRSGADASFRSSYAEPPWAVWNVSQLCYHRRKVGKQFAFENAVFARREAVD